MENKNQKQDVGWAHVFLALALLACAGFWKYRHAIEHWYYENLMVLVGSAMLFVALVIVIVVSRMKKKEAEFFENQRALKSIAPNRSINSYYERNR